MQIHQVVQPSTDLHLLFSIITRYEGFLFNSCMHLHIYRRLYGFNIIIAFCCIFFAMPKYESRKILDEKIEYLLLLKSSILFEININIQRLLLFARPLNKNWRYISNRFIIKQCYFVISSYEIVAMNNIFFAWHVTISVAM